jgi:alkylation response protein AidB-like acyl-CoA dehydrogenase
MAQEIADETLQLHGGYGFFEETGAAIRYRDSKMLDILSEPQSITIKRVWANLKNPNIWIR